MADLDFGDTPSDQLATLIWAVRALHRDMYGNGVQGIKAKAEAFMSEAAGAREEQARQHRANSVKLNWLLFLAAIITALTGVGMLIATVELTHRSTADPARLFHSFRNAPTLAQGNDVRVESFPYLR